MKSVLFFIPLAAGVLTVNQGLAKELELDAGNATKIPCNLTGVQLIWYWIPRYPICADIKRGQGQEIISVTASNHERKIDRFKKRLQMTSKRINGSYILTVQFYHMNDSGVFYCSNRSKNSSRISVIVKSGDQSGMEVEVPDDSSRGSGVFTLTCKPCEAKSEAETDSSSAITWTRNGRTASQMGRRLRNKLKIENKIQNYGLWRCHRPKCTTWSDGYCLENYFGMSEKFENEEIVWSTSAPPDGKKRLNLQIIIGGSVAGLLGLLVMGAAVFAVWHRLLSRRTSKTTKDPKSQGMKHSAGYSRETSNSTHQKNLQGDMRRKKRKRWMREQKESSTQN